MSSDYSYGGGYAPRIYRNVGAIGLLLGGHLTAFARWDPGPVFTAWCLTALLFLLFALHSRWGGRVAFVVRTARAAWHGYGTRHQSDFLACSEAVDKTRFENGVKIAERARQRRLRRSQGYRGGIPEGRNRRIA